MNKCKWERQLALGGLGGLAELVLDLGLLGRLVLLGLCLLKLFLTWLASQSPPTMPR